MYIIPLSLFTFTLFITYISLFYFHVIVFILPSLILSFTSSSATPCPTILHRPFSTPPHVDKSPPHLYDGL